MNVSIYSRNEAEFLLSFGFFPSDVAVISFYNSTKKTSDNGYTRVDYSGQCEKVFYCEFDDIDYSLLDDVVPPCFHNANELAAFIYMTYDSGLDIICQCEQGQSRSAGCAAAILEHFHHTGISVFTDKRRYPNRYIYQEVYEALESEAYKRNNRYYYHAAVPSVCSRLSKAGASSDFLKGLSFENGVSCAKSKKMIEELLVEKGKLVTSIEKAICCLNECDFVFLSLMLTALEPIQDSAGGSFGICSRVKHQCEQLQVLVWFDAVKQDYSLGEIRLNTEIRLLDISPLSLELLGVAVWDAEKRRIHVAPLFINNIIPKNS